ncbi:MAG: acyl-CoA dehydrogenase [Oscillospiraceae bacterium]|nr:acyl-CoA dehydrogenase [Oscillospiraceae bacterium]MBQ9109710.1 acyl-CoA dehydrogenase [Oscillospiraceae bacterium]
MNFTLSKEHQLAQNLFREFADKEVAPLAHEIDETERFPVETVEKMKKLGFLGIPYKKEYGGQGCDDLTYVLMMEQLGRVCGSTAIIASVHTSLCCGALNNAGTEEQKQKYLRPLCDGTWLGAFGLTEPSAGTDAASQCTRAVLDGDEYVLNGSKIFITNSGWADVYVIFAMTDKSQGSRGISAFIVPANTPGFSVGKPELKMGIRASTACELIFENVRIPKENLLGKEGKGFGIAMKALDGGRIGIAAQALGLAQGALDNVIAYVKERKQFGKPLSKLQNTQFTLADMETRVQAARLLVYSAAVAYDQGQPISVKAAQAKLFASETASYVTNRAVQLMGGYGYMREYPVERMMRDAKITEIYEGTSEVMRMVISGQLLK